MHAYVALELLRGFDVLFFEFFLLRELEEILIVVEVLEIKDGFHIVGIVPPF